MNVETIAINRDVAAAKLAAYGRIDDADLSDEDHAEIAGLKAISKGHELIDLARAMKAAGVDERGMPRLAIARADLKFAHFERLFAGAGRFHGKSEFGRDIGSIQVPAGTFDYPPNARRDTWRIRAVVPNVPPEFRPRGSLSGYHVLWEAEWEDAPDDPFLLRKINANLYAILAQWDLTPLEQSILRGRIAAESPL